MPLPDGCRSPCRPACAPWPFPGYSRFATRDSPRVGPHPGIEIEEVLPLDDALSQVAEVRIDPASGTSYATAPGGPTPRRVAHQLTIEIPPSGEVILQATATLSSGFDRQHLRRTNFEQAHALQKRTDPFVYQFAVRGPAGAVQDPSRAGHRGQRSNDRRRCAGRRRHSPPAATRVDAWARTRRVLAAAGRSGV